MKAKEDSSTAETVERNRYQLSHCCNHHAFARRRPTGIHLPPYIRHRRLPHLQLLPLLWPRLPERSGLRLSRRPLEPVQLQRGVYDSPLVTNTPAFVNWGTQFFSIPAGLCDMPPMDFYWNGNGFDFYEDEGDGGLLGTCIQGGNGATDCVQAFNEVLCNDA